MLNRESEAIPLDPFPGSTGCQPVLSGSLPESPMWLTGCEAPCYKGDRRQAADDYRLAACAPRMSGIRRYWSLVMLMLLFGFVSIAMSADPLDLALPTDNDALLRGDGPAFYQYIERNYHGEITTPWEGGGYGFVRDPIETSEGIVYTRFHEGIDIKPLHRDANGEPLDVVHAIANGKVVHANPVPGYSNYGRYVVIEHEWDGCRYYSLYAHLHAISVKPGQRVQKSEPIAVMGYTGVGINRERAHVHLELNLLLNHHFESWHDHVHPNDPNHNGIYNGINLAGLDIARLFLALQKNPSLTIPEFLRDEEAFYKVAFPKSRHFELSKNYPWMIAKTPDSSTQSWVVSFARTGLPLKIEASPERVGEPQVVYVKKSSVDYRHLTHDEVTGRDGHGRLTPGGENSMRLLIWPE